MLLEEMRCRVKKCWELLDLYELQESEILYDDVKINKTTNVMIFDLVVLQFLDTLLVQ